MSPVLSADTPFAHKSKVTIHPVDQQRADRPPLGDPVYEAVADREGRIDLEGKGLKHGRTYVAYREQDGRHQYVRFYVPRDGEKP